MTTDAFNIDFGNYIVKIHSKLKTTQYEEVNINFRHLFFFPKQLFLLFLVPSNYFLYIYLISGLVIKSDWLSRSLVIGPRAVGAVRGSVTTSFE